MKKETIYEHAKRIEELYYHQLEIARSEGKAFEDYSPMDLVLTAESILDVMEDWDSPLICDMEATRKQRRLLRNFVKKSLTEFDDLLTSLNLKFGMDVSPYKLDKE